MNTTHTSDQARGHVEPDLKAYVDGELSPIRRLIVARHLAGCPRCREKEQEMKKITENLTGWGGAKNTALPSNLRDSLIAQGPAGRGTDVPAYRPLWRRSPGLVFGGGTLSLAASFAAFAFLYNTANQSTTTATAAFSDSGEAVAVAAAAPDKTAIATMTEAAPAASSAVAPSVEPSAEYAQSVTNGNEVSRRVVAPFARNAPSQADKLSMNADQAVAGTATRGAAFAQRQTPRVTAAPPMPTQNWDADGLTQPSLSIDARQVHRAASLGVAVDNPEAASAKVETLVKEWGGYVASNVLTTDESGYKSADLTLKVPEERFDEMLSSLAKMGDVRSKNITGEDITEQTSDATSDEQVLIDEASKLDDRLKNQSLSERRTQQTEAQLRQVRQELARTRARLGLLRKLARLSTLNVTLTEKQKVEVGAAPQSGFWFDMKDSNRAALKAFQAAVRVPLLLIIWVIALSPLWLPLLLAYRHLSRKQQLAHDAARIAEKETAPSETASASVLDR